MTPPVAELPPGLTEPRARGRSSQLIGELLVELGFATTEQVERAVVQGRETKRVIGRVLVEDGIVTSDQLAHALALRLGLLHVDLARFPIDKRATTLLDPAVTRRHGAVPVGFLDGGNTVILAMADAANVFAVDDIAMLTGLEVRPAIASPQAVAALIMQLDGAAEAASLVSDDPLGSGSGSATATSSAPGAQERIALIEGTDEAPIIQLVHKIISQAVDRGASDIHFVPQNGELRGQFRIDGILTDAFTVPAQMSPHVVSRIKIMADLDISERRTPQDGRLGFELEGRSVDVRIVTLPLVEGESVVMRLLDQGSGGVSLDDLGMLDQERSRFERAISRNHGAVLATGPTGSGKTTSLYAALQVLNDGKRSILTLEDPVEYRVAGIKQMQVNAKAGVTFSTGLRSMMRADPDVVLVGEIHDRDTARIAVESALTGHLVLSTLHTNDAPTAITRLIEMGIEPFLVASAIECVVAQRLARKLCDTCRREVTVNAEVLRGSGFSTETDIVAFEPVGCPQCNGSGYRGRVGLYEVMSMSDRIRAHALARDAASDVLATAVAEGMRRMRDDGLEKVRAGLTSIAEVTRVTVAS